MQNKANLCRFQAKNNDYTQKQSQTKPNKANSNPIYHGENRVKTKTKPISKPNKANFKR